MAALGDGQKRRPRMRKRDEPARPRAWVRYDDVEPLDAAATGVVAIAARVLPAIEAITIAHAASPVALASGSLATARRRCLSGANCRPLTLGRAEEPVHRPAAT